MTAKKLKTVTVPAGKQAIFVPENVKGMVCIMLGDVDHDGKPGFKALAFADLPDVFDNKPGLEPIGLINNTLPEFDSLGEHDLPAAFDRVTDAVKPVVAFLAGLTKVFRK